MYDYETSVREDVMTWIKENIEYLPDEVKQDRESFEEYLNDELFVDDSVTGNASGSYTFSVNEAAENLVGNFDLLDEVFSEFGQPNFNSRSWSDFPEFADVSIRCYLLGGAISDCLDELGEDIYVDVEEDEDY